MHAHVDLVQGHLSDVGLAVEGPLEIPYGHQLVVRNGAQRVTVSIYEKNGKCVPQGPNGPLLDLVKQLCTQVNDGEPVHPTISNDGLDAVLPELVAEGVDEAVIRYLRESLVAIRADMLMAGVFLLGGASERMVYLLIDSFLSAIKDAGQRRVAASQKLVVGSFLDRLEALTDRLEKVKSQLPREAKFEWDNNLSRLADYYRICRNEVGHPCVPPRLEPLEVRLSFVGIKPYLLGLKTMMDHLNSATITYPA